MFCNKHTPAVRLSVVRGSRIRGAGRGGGVGSETLRGAGTGTGRLTPSWWLTGVEGRSPLAVYLAGVWVSSSFSPSSSSSSLSSKGLGGEEERGFSSVAPLASMSFAFSKESALFVVTGVTVAESMAGVSVSFVRLAGDGVFVRSLSEGEVWGVVLRQILADCTAIGLLLRSGRPFWLAKACLARWCVQTNAPESLPIL